MATFPLAVAPDSATTGFRDAIGIPGMVVLIALCTWSLGFALYGIALCLNHVFRTADIHEVLPPVLATVLAWVMAALGIINNANAEVPVLARIVFLLGAPVSVTVLSCWELYRLRKYHNLSARQALGRWSVYRKWLERLLVGQSRGRAASQRSSWNSAGTSSSHGSIPLRSSSSNHRSRCDSGRRRPHQGQKSTVMLDLPPSWMISPYSWNLALKSISASGQAKGSSCWSQRTFTRRLIASQQWLVMTSASRSSTPCPEVDHGLW
ncbi:hypothetical protein [Streptomyces violascens]|uniref:hypothetical protein n=1 Tax=Streptomyces violascens TaxID=67381 RepID=UPI0027E54616|nr:hypothetical protein [Streptomyces violascens]